MCKAIMKIYKKKKINTETSIWHLKLTKSKDTMFIHQYSRMAVL
jgi:hypothetical protein